jgi:hypothetical protein
MKTLKNAKIPWSALTNNEKTLLVLRAAKQKSPDRVSTESVSLTSRKCSGEK